MLLQMSNDQRKCYWNDEYAQYWQKRVEEGNRGAGKSQVVKEDSAVPSDELYTELVRILEIPEASRVLEIGCGFGRTLPIISMITDKIDAIDISEAMIEMARKNCGHLKGVHFQVSEAEKMPFPSGRFARVICFGVFDALYQREALIEINRVMTRGGRVLITGKNDHYLADDDKALVAEVNARAKGHPNYFTDVSKLISSIDLFGFAVCHKRFYLRRGDTALNKFTSERPPRFYEYALVLEKVASVKAAAKILLVGSSVSKTFAENQHAPRR